ncbi:hypothetical protein LAY57_01910 [Argonema antarcticum A004/B2]|nr:hypothetical protein [Argonema antarcticum A004/B2]
MKATAAGATILPENLNIIQILLKESASPVDSHINLLTFPVNSHNQHLKKGVGCKERN